MEKACDQINSSFKCHAEESESDDEEDTTVYIALGTLFSILACGFCILVLALIAVYWRRNRRTLVGIIHQQP